MNIELQNAVGITDTISVIGAFFRTVADSVVLTDTISTVGTFIISLQDSVAITDAITSLKKILVSIVDTVGITDILAITVTQIIFLIKEIERTAKPRKPRAKPDNEPVFDNCLL